MDTLLLLADRYNGAGQEAYRQFRNEDPCRHAATVLKEEVDLDNAKGFVCIMKAEEYPANKSTERCKATVSQDRAIEFFLPQSSLLF